MRMHQWHPTNQFYRSWQHLRSQIWGWVNSSSCGTAVRLSISKVSGRSSCISPWMIPVNVLLFWKAHRQWLCWSRNLYRTNIGRRFALQKFSKCGVQLKIPTVSRALSSPYIASGCPSTLFFALLRFSLLQGYRFSWLSGYIIYMYVCI